MHCYEFPHPALAVDIAVFRRFEGETEIVLIERAREPYRGRWALPGGFVEIDEDLEQAARRELAEETGIEGIALEQLRAFGAPERDPRERVVSIAYWGLLADARAAPQGASDAQRARWFRLDGLPSLAFDHDEIVAAARRRLSDARGSGSSSTG